MKDIQIENKIIGKDRPTYFIADSHIRSIRPRFGLPPKYYDRIIGRVSSKDVERGRPVDWTLFGE